MPVYFGATPIFKIDGVHVLAELLGVLFFSLFFIFLFLILTCAAVLFLERRQNFQTSHNCSGFFSRCTVMNSNS